jgi:predicted O-methyltransferase YrrM
MNASGPLNFLQEHISTVNVDLLHQRLNYMDPCIYPKISRQKSFLDWKMQIDDAPIFRYLFRNVKPGRHLEFGTWEGFGTRLCLEETDATVWTLNLPFGERDLTDESRVCYSFNDTKEDLAAINAWSEKAGITKEFVQTHRRTDCIGFIGRLYLEKNMGNRVCQIYCDSREWDISKYPDGFFDSVLIDGGHLKDIVLNDTQKAMKLVKPGGMIMWHDFCMNQEIYQNFKASQGVMDCVFENWDYISSNLRDLFWIEPSFILTGIRK